MKVYNSVITNQYKPNFKSNEWHVFGIDEGGQAKRDNIRKWRDKYIIPYQSIYENGHRLSEFELKQVMSDLVRKPVIVDDERINQLHLQNLDFAGKTSYRGAMITPDELEKVEKLYNAGIRRIIPIGRGYTDLRDECQKLGMLYQAIEFDSQYNDAFKTVDEVKSSEMHFARDVIGLDEKGALEMANRGVELWKKNSRRYIDEFTQYIQKMQKGNVYMGCDFGTYNTDTALMFDYLFNPKMHHGNGLNHLNERFVRCAENLYRNMTDADKLKMGWNKDFDFFKRLGRLKDIIH